jgi:hypothetical protein
MKVPFGQKMCDICKSSDAMGAFSSFARIHVPSSVRARRSCLVDLISGVDLPRDKRVEIGLTYIYGIGLTTATKILQATGVNPDTASRTDRKELSVT